MKSDAVFYQSLLASSYHCEIFEDKSGKAFFLSDSCKTLLGLSDKEHEGETTLSALIALESLEDYGKYSKRIREAEDDAFTSIRVILNNAKRTEVLLSGRSIRIDGQHSGIRSTMTVIGDLIEKTPLAEADGIDHLTGLYGRAACVNRLRRMIRKVKDDPDYEYAVIYVDVDRLKKINDAFGISAGDRIIRMSAKRMERSMPDDAFIARLGGDEFFIVLEGLSSRAVVKIVKKMIITFNEPFRVNKHEIPMSAGFGVVLSPSEFTEPEDFIRNANIAVRKAKQTRHKFKVFTSKMLEKSSKAMELEVDLYSAIEKDQFFIQYQPIYSLETRKLKGVEALVRWRHPKWGLLPPDDFIPIAEETGFIIALGYWVLKHACLDMQSWIEKSAEFKDLSVSVNLSAQQLNHFGILDQVMEVLRETGLSPACLKLEITETIAMMNPELTAEKLMALKEMGVRVSIDDFGTGYSSLSYLQSLPIDTIKVDKSFVCMMDKNPKKRKIVRSVITLAHNLRLNVVAEGIEMDEHWTMLKALDCESGQGFLFSRPVDKENVIDIFEADF